MTGGHRQRKPSPTSASSLNHCFTFRILSIPNASARDIGSTFTGELGPRSSDGWVQRRRMRIFKLVRVTVEDPVQVNQSPQSDGVGSANWQRHNSVPVLLRRIDWVRFDCCHSYDRPGARARYFLPGFVNRSFRHNGNGSFLRTCRH